MLKELFEESYREYNDYMSKNVPEYWDHDGYKERRLQAECLINALNDRFNFEQLITLETGVSQSLADGLFGVFLGMVTEKTNGRMIAVDTNENFVRKSQDLFTAVMPNLKYLSVHSDSVEYLKTLDIVPNFVHLDSMDLNLKSPMPCALQGWREFVEVESKMPSGSIIMLDDNYRDGGWVNWNYTDGRVEKIVHQYPMIGKGSLVYHWVTDGRSDWELIGDHYNLFNNIKIIIQKK